MSRDKQALLTDFGISRMESLSNGYSTESSKGNARWQAREFLQFSEGQTSPKHTFATDIWAFGMTIYVWRLDSFTNRTLIVAIL